MPRTEIWEDPMGARIEITANWPGVPVLRGPAELLSTVQAALDSTPYPGEDWTTPILDKERERALVDRGLTRVAYRTDFSLSEAHLKATVRQAEASAREYRKALEGYAKYQQELEERKKSGGSGTIDFLTMMWTLHMDRALEGSRSAVILAVASAEAFISERASDAPGWDKGLDRAQLPTKWLLLPQLLAGKTFDKGRMPYQSLVELNKLRNKIVHGRSDVRMTEISDSSEAEAYMAVMFARPEWGVTPTSGRWACTVVRSMCMAYCRIVDEDPPRFLAYVPPADPDELQAWVSASIMTRVRDDPDFPKRPSPFWE